MQHQTVRATYFKLLSSAMQLLISTTVQHPSFSKEIAYLNTLCLGETVNLLARSSIEDKCYKWHSGQLQKAWHKSCMYQPSNPLLTLQCNIYPHQKTVFQMTAKIL